MTSLHLASLAAIFNTLLLAAPVVIAVNIMRVPFEYAAGRRDR